MKNVFPKIAMPKLSLSTKEMNFLERSSFFKDTSFRIFRSDSYVKPVASNEDADAAEGAL